MSKYTIREVKTAADRRKFLTMAVDLYKGDPNWVQPWDHDIESVFDPAKNKQFQGGEAVRWILTDDDSGKVVGRIAAFYNRESAAAEEVPTGGCGFFECIDDHQAADMLFDAARDWLAARGMEAMDGSVNFGDRLFWWGVLVEGFEQPIYTMNYNHPYYGQLFEEYGFQNYFNQYSFLRRFDPDIVMDQVFIKSQRLFENPDYSFECVDMKRLPEMAENFRKVYNSAWADFPGVKPLTSEHAREMMNALKPIIDPEVLYFAYYQGEPVGFFIMIPDINPIVKLMRGKFGLWQKLKFMYHLKVKRTPNRLSGLIFGVDAEFQGRGVESGLIRMFEMYVDSRREKGTTVYQNLDMAWVGDFNPLMIRLCEQQIKAVKYKRHVTYRYLFDRERPFKRAPLLRRKKNTDATAVPPPAGE